jgi:hypothetical protein
VSSNPTRSQYRPFGVIAKPHPGDTVPPILRGISNEARNSYGGRAAKCVLANGVRPIWLRQRSIPLHDQWGRDLHLHPPAGLRRYCGWSARQHCAASGSPTPPIQQRSGRARQLRQQGWAHRPSPCAHCFGRRPGRSKRTVSGWLLQFQHPSQWNVLSPRRSGAMALTEPAHTKLAEQAGFRSPGHCTSGADWNVSEEFQ